jgi:hypothetical protein
LIIDVLVTAGDPDNPLSDQGAQPVHHRVCPAPVLETGRHPIARSASCRNSAPASELIAPPSCA